MLRYGLPYVGKFRNLHAIVDIRNRMRRGRSRFGTRPVSRSNVAGAGGVLSPTMANKDRSRQSGTRKRKFYGNQHSVSSRNASRVECGSGDVNLSASARKLRFDLPPELRWAETASDPDSTSCNDTSSDDEASELAFSARNGSAGTRLVDLGEQQRALDSTACCKRCKAGSLVLEESRREGLASIMRFSCNQRACGHTEEVPLAKRGSGGSGKLFEVNRCAVLAMRKIDRGLSALLKICCILNMPRPMAKSSFNGHRAALHHGCSMHGMPFHLQQQWRPGPFPFTLYAVKLVGPLATASQRLL